MRDHIHGRAGQARVPEGGAPVPVTAHEEPGGRDGLTGVRSAREGPRAIVGLTWGVRGLTVDCKL